MQLVNKGPSDARNFWSELAPYQHLVQIYDDEEAFLVGLMEFVAGGIDAGDAIVVIATTERRQAIHRRMHDVGFDVASAQESDRFISLDAGETMTRFMTDGWPDESRFNETVADLLHRAGRDGRCVRVFGEMVALLWAQGHCGATVRLEYLWQQLCSDRRFSLLCAYPRSGFTQDASESIRQICDAHSHIVQSAGLVPRGISTLNELAKLIDRDARA